MIKHRPPVLLLTLLTLLGAPAVAQTGSVEFELGVQGAVVQDAWNPLRLALRDLPAVELELRIDQGSLRSGPIVQLYRVPLEASRGLTVFEDDVYVPAWRSLAWTVRSADRTVASGTLDPRLADARALTLLVSRSPGRWLSSLPPGARAQEVAAASLPARAASYSGVAALLIDGTAPAPTLESVVAAAAAGVAVVLVEPLPGSHDELRMLAESGTGTIAAGRLMVAGPDAVAEALAGTPAFPAEETLDALLGRAQVTWQPPISRVAITVAGALYALLIVALLRFGGEAGIPAALVVAALTAGGGWLLLRPDQPLLEEDRTVVVSAGGLGLALPARVLRSLPGGEVTLDAAMRFRRPVAHAVGHDSTTIGLSRWQRELLIGRPALTAAGLEWSGDRLANRGTGVLVDVLVTGLGPQGSLAPGEERLVSMSEEAELSGPYAELAALLPVGTALARDGERYHVALPPGPASRFAVPQGRGLQVNAPLPVGAGL